MTGIIPENIMNESEQLKFLIENSDDIISIHDFERQFEENIFSIKKNNKIVSVVKICKDVTEKKLAKKTSKSKKFFQKSYKLF